MPPDLLSFFDLGTAIALVAVGLAFGIGVLGHLPTSLQLGPAQSLFFLAIADVMPWVVIIGFRGLRHYQNPDLYPTWYISIGTLLMFLVFDLGAAGGIAIIDKWERRQRRIAVELAAVRVK